MFMIKAPRLNSVDFELLAIRNALRRVINIAEIAFLMAANYSYQHYVSIHTSILRVRPNQIRISLVKFFFNTLRKIQGR